MTDKTATPILRSLPLVERLQLPDRAELLPKIDSGEIDHLDFRARVFMQGPNRNSYRFRDQDMPDLATSFEGQPFLRNHASGDINQRDGTILASTLQDGAIVQDIRLTTRRGMTDYLEGKIDRFSIGWWDYTDITCNICGGSWLSPDCPHWPGRTYKETKCEITFVNPKGLETSAVNAPAVPGTGIESALQCKLDIISRIEPDPVANDDTPASGGQVPAADDLTPAVAQARQARADRLAQASQLTFKGVTPMNIRELQKQRAGLITQASALHETAEAENRDLTEAERAEFTRLMDESDALAAKITTITAERERIAKALESLATTVAEPIKPEASSNPNTKKRAEFDALSPLEQAAFVKNGGVVQD